MIGQEKLKKEIDINKTPIILVGKKGSGKKTFINELAKLENIEVKYINSTLSNDIKLELYTYTNKILIVFDLTYDLQYKQFISFQNSILKVLEDPPEYCKFIILSENSSELLNTLISRCYIKYMNPYSISELYLIADKYNNLNIKDYSDNQLKYITCPSDVIIAPPVKELIEIENLVDTILSSIYNANISNILSISKKLSFSDSESGYNIYLFINIFKNKLNDILKDNFTMKYFNIFNLFLEFESNINKLHRNKINLLEEFLLNIKYI